MSEFPHAPLIQLPTPLHKLSRLSQKLGVDLWIKRDDLTGFGEGGNKGRKLEYLLGDALENGYEVVVSCGSSQSNFVRQLGVACKVLGLKCAAATMQLPYDTPAGKPNFEALNLKGGNIALDKLSDLDLRVYPDDDWMVLYDYQEKLAQEYEEKGFKVYRIAVGGSSALGALAFYKAADELKKQAGEPFDWLVTGTSSGSTQIGLTYGFHGSETKVLGISADPEPELAEEFAENGEKFAELIGISPLTARDFNMNFDYVGPGYATWSDDGLAAIREMWQTEGILLDPIYSGKAFAGLLDLIKTGKLSGRIVFWHTGGAPSFYALPESVDLLIKR